MRRSLVFLFAALAFLPASLAISVSHAASPWDGEWEGALVQSRLPCSPCKVRLSVQDGVTSIRSEISIPNFTIDGKGQVSGAVSLSAPDFAAECALSGRVSGNALSVTGRCVGSNDSVQMSLRRVSFTAGDPGTGSDPNRTRDGNKGNQPAPSGTLSQAGPLRGKTNGATAPSASLSDTGPTLGGSGRSGGVKPRPSVPIPAPGIDDDEDGSLRQREDGGNDRGYDRGNADRNIGRSGRGNDGGSNPGVNPGGNSGGNTGGDRGNSGPPIQLAAVPQFKGQIVDNMKAILPGVVEIRIKDSLGSGFVIDAAQGLILTNYHVIGTASTVTVVFNGEEKVNGTVVRRDQTRDVALIKVQKKNLTVLPIRLGEVIPAEKAYAIGSPFGLSQTVSEGIISSYRKMKGQDQIQATPAISPGNSGGPLLDGAGNVIGISQFILTPGVGTDFRFFIPIGSALTTLNIKPAAN